MTLSLCMIIKDEEQTLKRILNKAKCFSDEMIIVDTGSSDNSVNIAKSYTDKVYFCEFVDFSFCRNFSLSKATCDYVIWLDADDDIDEKNIQKIIQLKDRLFDEDMVMMPYETAFDENDMPVFCYYRERIFKNRKGFFFEGKVHEAIPLKGKIIYEDIAIKHRKTKQNTPLRNLNIYQNMMAKGEILGTRELFYLANEYYYNNMYTEALATYKEFQKRKDCLDANLLQSFVNSSNILINEEKYSLAFDEIAKSLKYSLPTPTILCQIGYVLHKWQKYEQSNYYYLLAVSSQEDNPFAFRNSDFEGYTPFIMIGLNYYLSGDIDNALYYTSKALKIKPYGKIALDNNAYYLSLKIKKLSSCDV